MRKTTYAASGPTIIVQAPCRADLAGGTIDLWPLYSVPSRRAHGEFCGQHPHHCRITPLKGRRIHLRSVDTRREEDFSSFDELRTANCFRLLLGARLLQFFAPKEGLLMETDSESPAGAGISGSSALMIASTAALARFTGRNLTLEQMRVIAQNVEAQIIQILRMQCPPNGVAANLKVHRQDGASCHRMKGASMGTNAPTCRGTRRGV